MHRDSFFVCSAASSLPARMGCGCRLALRGRAVEVASCASAAEAASVAARGAGWRMRRPMPLRCEVGRTPPTVDTVAAGGACLSRFLFCTKAFVWTHEGLRDVKRRPSRGMEKFLEWDGESVRRQVRVGERVGADVRGADAGCGASGRREPCVRFPVAAAG